MTSRPRAPRRRRRERSARAGAEEADPPIFYRVSAGWANFGGALAVKGGIRGAAGRGLMDFEKLVAAAGDAIVVADPQGRIVLWNPAAERIFGFSAAEALGASLDLIIPERFRQRHWNGYDEVMRSGTTRYGVDVLRVPALRKDGRPLSIAFTVALLKDAQGRVESIAAIMRDDTARWNEERALKKRLATGET